MDLDQITKQYIKQYVNKLLLDPNIQYRNPINHTINHAINDTIHNPIINIPTTQNHSNQKMKTLKLYIVIFSIIIIIKPKILFNHDYTLKDIQFLDYKLNFIHIIMIISIFLCYIDFI